MPRATGRFWSARSSAGGGTQIRSSSGSTAPNVWFRPLCLSISQGYWVNILKVTRAGVRSRHRHTNPAHGYVLKGRWHYLEHGWVAEEGGYVYEPPGGPHTLVVPEDVEEMITLFSASTA